MVESTEESELPPYERGTRSGTWTEDRLMRFFWGHPYHGICSAEGCLKQEEETFAREYALAQRHGDEDLQHYWSGRIAAARETLQALKDQGY